MMLSDVTEANRPYEPRGAARDLMYCRDEEILLEGPAGTGKSRGLLEKLHICLEKYPGCRVLATRKTRESMTESVLVTWEDKVVPRGHPILEGPKRNLRQAYHYPNGSELIIGGMDKPGKIMSTEFDLIAVFEGTELFEDDFEKLTTRLRNGRMPYQQIIVDCNPEGPGHWLNLRAKAGRMTRLLSRHEDNPVLYRAEQWTPAGQVYIAKLERLTGARYLRLRKGVWAASEGMVYSSWDAAIHLIDSFEPPASWRRVLSIDFGYTNPFVCQWWALDEDGRAYLYREIYRSKRLVQDHAEQIGQLRAGEHIESTVSDHDAEDRATLQKYGITTTAAKKEVLPGINAVAERLRPAADGRPRLFVMRDALVERDPLLVDAKLPTCTAEEIEGYVWAKGRETLNQKEEPVKAGDHGMDAMRYFVMHVDGSGPMRIYSLDEDPEVIEARRREGRLEPEKLADPWGDEWD